MAEPSAVDQECVEGYLFTHPPLRLLLFRRPPARGGFWAPVSGKVDPSDRDFRSALSREIEEETGIRDPHRVFPLDWVVPFEGPDGRRWRLHAYGVELNAEVTPRLSDEHDAHAWVDWEEALKRLHFSDNRGAVERLRDILDGSTGTKSARGVPSASAVGDGP